MLWMLACAFAAGVFVADAIALGFAAALAIACAAAATAIVARRRERLVGVALLGLGLALGALAQASARPRAPPALTDGNRWTIEGAVVAAPERAFGVARVPIALAAVERDGERRAATGVVSVAIAGD